MFAILETGSKQYKVAVGDILEVELLKEDTISKDNTVNFDSVLLVKSDDLHIGQPVVKDAQITAKVLDELKAPKIIVFKKKAKKHYKRTRGHRQKLHRIQIEKIQLGIKTEKETETKPKPEAKKEPIPETKVKPKAKAEAKPKPKTKVEAKKEIKPKAEAKAKPKAETKAKPKTETKAKAAKKAEPAKTAKTTKTTKTTKKVDKKEKE